MDLKSTYDRIAEDWYRDHSNDDWWVDATNKFITLVGPGATVLDVGCGAGVKSHYLIERGLQVVGIDFSEKMIEIAKREVLEGRFRVMDMHDLSGLEGKFDGIFVQAALLHIPKAEVSKIFSNFVKQLKSGGYLYIAVKETRQGQKDEETLRENDYGYVYERFFSYFTLPEIKKYFADCNTEIVYESIKTVGKTNWIQVIGKQS